MKVTIKYFGLIADITHQKEEVFTFDVDTLKLGDLMESLSQEYAGLNQASFSVAVNKKMATDDLLLADNDVVALLPPFAGG
ncbi:MAG TPA: MoaD/ThiS family protein [Pelobium sp.]